MTFNSGKLNYQFSPTSHNDPCYNKNQAKFYKQDADKKLFSILICLLLRLNKKIVKIFGRTTDWAITFSTLRLANV